MGIALIVIGVVALAVGSGLLFGGRRTQAKVNLIRSVPTSDAAGIRTLLPGELVELKGTIRCDSPLTSEHAKRPCVWYSANVTREYEERSQDSKGNWQTSRGSENVSSNTVGTPFDVEDATGRVRVYPDGAEVDAPTVVDRFEDRPDGGGPTLSIGGVTLGFDGAGGRRTLGYRTVEKLLAVDTPIYVLGAVREGGEIGRPPASRKDGKLILSARSEEDLERDWASHARGLAYGAIASFVLGGAAIIAGLLLLVS